MKYLSNLKLLRLFMYRESYIKNLMTAFQWCRVTKLLYLSTIFEKSACNTVGVLLLGTKWF